jgi:CRP/FNR family cyclic AMP-dependent transcriptional regulator
MIDKFWYLQKTNIFSDLTYDDIKDIEKITQLTTSQKLQPIYIEGSLAKNIYIIKTGKVKISKFLPDGKEITLTILGQGDIFGELSLFDDINNHTAEALENTDLCTMKKEDFENLLKTKPDLHFKVTKLIGFRLRSVENKVQEVLFKDIKSRLASLFLNLLKKYSKNTNDGIEVNLNLSHEEIGKLIATNRQTVTQKLNEMKNEGLIDTRRKRIIITNLEELKKIYLSESLEFVV